MQREAVLACCAKTAKEPGGGYHPLLYHMLDVAAVAGVSVMGNVFLRVLVRALIALNT